MRIRALEAGVCVCVREREREREAEIDREAETEGVCGCACVCVGVCVDGSRVVGESSLTHTQHINNKLATD